MYLDNHQKMSPIMKKISTMLLITALLTPPLAIAASNDDDLAEKQAESITIGSGWTLIRNDTLRNIKTYAKQEDNKKFRSFKIDMIVDAPLETVAKVHFDVDNIKKWYWSTSESKLLKKVSDTEYYYYQVYRTPIVPDRDVIIHAKIEPYTAEKGFMALNLEAVPDYMPIQGSYVRMSAHNMAIKMTPIDNDKKTHLEVDGYIDPSGVSPAWAINFYQRKSPYITMVGLSRMVQQPQYSAEAPSPFRYKR